MHSEKSHSRFIDSSQIIIILAAFGVLCCVSYGGFGTLGGMLADTVASAVILALLAVPVVLLANKEQGSVPEIIAAGNSMLGKAAAVLYGIYFIAAASDFIRRYGEFVSERYFTEASAEVCIVLLGLVCVYISWAGAETVCRMSTVMLFLAAATSAAFVIFGREEFSMPEFRPESISLADGAESGIFIYGAAAVASMCMLCSGAGKRTRKGVYCGLAAFMLVTAVLVFTAFSVLGDFSLISEYPVTDMVIYASGKLSFRPDGIYFTLWTIIAAGVISLLSACAGQALKVVFTRVRGEGIITGAAVTAAGLICALTDSKVCTALCSYPSAVILIAVIPLLTLAVSGKGKTDRNGGKAQ